MPSKQRKAALEKAQEIVRWRYGNHPPENFVRKIADALQRERGEAERAGIELCENLHLIETFNVDDQRVGDRIATILRRRRDEETSDV